MFDKHLRDCAAITRRQMLARSSVGFGLTALTGMLSAEGPELMAPEKAGRVAPGRTQDPRAKSFIFCFMSGGVSAVDTFDPKPRLAIDHGKPMPVPIKPTMFNANGNIMASPWKFKKHGKSGLPISELFPEIACGYHAVENKSTVYDLWATVLHQLGVDHEALTYRSGGRDFRLTDVHGNVLHDVLT